jgi:uncharacterized membrane protein YbhN (UPF0104 family)
MSSQRQTATADLALPAFDVRAIARRAAVPGALAAVVVAVLLVAGGPLHAFEDAIRRAVDADPRWVILAAVAELASFGGYIALLWLIGSKATPRLGLSESTQVTLGGAAATRLLPTAGVGGAALTLWALRRTGMGSRRATLTLMTFLVTLYAFFLGAIVVAGLALAVGLAHRTGSLAVCLVPAIGAAAVLGVALTAAALAPRDLDAGGRHVRALSLIGAAVRDALALVRRPDARLLGAPMWWAFDAAVLWAMLHAFGAPPSLAVLALAYFVGQVGNTIPFPGAVSIGMVGILVAFGVPADLALVSVLAYRAVAIWLPAPIGLVALSGLRKTVARWGREGASDADAREAELAAAPTVAAPARVLMPAPAAVLAATADAPLTLPVRAPHPCGQPPLPLAA